VRGLVLAPAVGAALLAVVFGTGAASSRQACPAGAQLPLGNSKTAFLAVAGRPTRAFAQPGRGVRASFGVLDELGHDTVFGVLGAVLGPDCTARWYRVRLPIRPNGSTGFVPAVDVDLQMVHTSIVVDLSERRLSLYRWGRLALRAPIAIGAPATPTPTGRFYVYERVLTVDPRGPYGPGAIAVSAFSEADQGWARGGPIAIHGTNEPWKIGRAVSHGCIRMRNDLLRRLFRQTPAGTPVLLRA
jgi:hypothetical protein